MENFKIPLIHPGLPGGYPIDGKGADRIPAPSRLTLFLLTMTPPRFILLCPGILCLMGLLSFSGAQETLSQALDDPALTWVAGGDFEWKAAVRPGAHTGASVAELWLKTGPAEPHYGFELHDSESWLETTATGPGVFAVQVRHNHNPYVKLSLSVDGEVAEEFQIYDWPQEPETFSDWLRFTAFVPSGSHKIRLQHQFQAAGTIPIDNPKVQADDAHLLPALGADFLKAIEVPPAEGSSWFAGGGGEFQVVTEGAHDGVDALVSDSRRDTGDSWYSSSSPWLRRELSGPVTLQWWQRQLSRYDWEADGAWVRQSLFIPAGTRTVSWSGWHLALDEFSETAAPEVSLGEALESGDRVFTPTEGVWKGALTSAAPDGVDAVWTQVSAAGKSSLETVIDGPASLHFQTGAQVLNAVDWAASGGALTCDLDGLPLHLEGGAWTGLIPPGRHVVQWSLLSRHGVNKSTGALLDQVRITQTPALSLGEALDAPDLPWTTSGEKPWVGIAGAQPPDGQDAAVPPLLAPGETAWLETRVTGPGRLTFQWTGVEPGSLYYDPLRGLTLSIDGQKTVNQNGGQLNPRLDLGPGTHTLRWTATGLAELRPLLLNQVIWTPLDPAPLLAAAENPAVQFFAANAEMVTLSYDQNYEGESSIRIAGNGSAEVVALAQTLTAIADRPGTLSYYYKLSPAARLSPSGNTGEGEWRFARIFLEPGAQTFSWTVTGLPSAVDPAPSMLLDKILFQPEPLIGLDQALKDPGPWRTSPELPWLGLNEKGAWSGKGTVDLPSWIEREVTGPAVFAYTWSGEGLSFVLDHETPQILSNNSYPYQARRFLWIPPGAHRLRWRSSSEHASISDIYLGAVPGELALTLSGDDFLIRVPRPAGMSDNLIGLQFNSGAALDANWRPVSQPAVESSTADSITFRVANPQAYVPRVFYRAAFGY